MSPSSPVTENWGVWPSSWKRFFAVKLREREGGKDRSRQGREEEGRRHKVPGDIIEK
jgi:hypothetical protein